MRRMLVVALLVLVSLGGAALSGHAPREAATPAADPIRVRVELTQGRVDEVRHTVQVSMHNDGPARLVVQQIELRAPSFKGAGPVKADAWLPTGGLQVDVPVSYGTGICTGDDLHPRAAPATVALRVQTGDGKVSDVQVPLAAPNPMLDKVLAI